MDVNIDHPARLAAFFHHRWTAPILAELHRGEGAKYVTLQRRLGINRDSLRRTLEHLIEEGLVVRNPGYGHPMRPEYLLAPMARELAAATRSLVERLDHAGLPDPCLRKWSLAVLLAIGGGADRFSAIAELLPGATHRALTLTLRRLDAVGLIARQVLEEYPPRTRYVLERRARAWMPQVAELAAALVATGYGARPGS